MVIIHFVFSFYNGGKENLIIDIANEQVRLGHNVLIVVLNNKYNLNVLNQHSDKVGINLINSKKHIFGRFCSAFKIVQVFNSFNPDIIHCHDPILVVFKKLYKKSKFVLTVHNMRKPNRIIAYYDTVFAISKAVSANIERYLNLKSRVIYNGIDLDRVVQKINNFNKKHIKIITVGNLRKDKGHDILIKAVNHILKSRFLLFSIDIIGEGDDRKKIQEMINYYNLSDHVNLLGSKPKKWIYNNLCNYDLFVHPSRSEGFGISVLEAMAAKLPVIMSNTGGLFDLSGNGQYGFLFESESFISLSKTIIDVIDMDINQINKNIKLTFEYASQRFHIRNTTQDYLKHYLS